MRCRRIHESEGEGRDIYNLDSLQRISPARSSAITAVDSELQTHSLDYVPRLIVYVVVEGVLVPILILLRILPSLTQ